MESIRYHSRFLSLSIRSGENPEEDWRGYYDEGKGNKGKKKTKKMRKEEEKQEKDSKKEEEEKKNNGYIGSKKYLIIVKRNYTSSHSMTKNQNQLLKTLHRTTQHSRRKTFACESGP